MKFLHHIILVITLLFTQNVAFSEEVNPNDIVRVLISTDNMSSFEHKDLSITSDNEYSVYIDDVLSFKSLPDEYTTISLTPNSLSLLNNNEYYNANRCAKIIIKSQNGGLLSVMGLTRKSRSAKYRGDFEIYALSKDKLRMINVLQEQDYLKGVVPNEMPVGFGIEALKAQAVAARNYAKKPRENKKEDFDVYDTVASQVYFGANTEDALANQAVDETNGLYAIYDGELITALYHSTAGGHTESYENAFSDPCEGKFPANAIDYLKGKTRLKDVPKFNLRDEETARMFYSVKPDTFDKESPLYRWNYEWSEEELRSILSKNIKKYSNTSFVKAPILHGDDIGTIQNIEVLKRGISGKAMYIKITTDSGHYYIAKEFFIRKIFEYNGKMLPSANIFFDFDKDAAGNITTIKVTGGGFGHGVGMSQFGAAYLSKQGVTFDKILKFYYTGISIGTNPTVINLKENQGKIIDFIAPEGKGTLVIQNPYLSGDINIKVNNDTIELSDYYLSKKLIRLNIDNYLIKGNNNLTVLPSSQSDFGVFYKKPSTIKLWVEVYEADEANGNSNEN